MKVGSMGRADSLAETPNKERGQAHLPDHELSHFRVDNCVHDCKRRILGQLRTARGQEGGLAPLLLLSFTCETTCLTNPTFLIYLYSPT